MVLYTDGLTEARPMGGHIFGERRLREAVCGRPADDVQSIAQGLRDAAIAYAGRLRDDLHILALRLVDRD